MNINYIIWGVRLYQSEQVALLVICLFRKFCFPTIAFAHLWTGHNAQTEDVEKSYCK
ncbi:MAG: hypothetical protein R6U46_06795 [Marinilabilia sp.]